MQMKLVALAAIVSAIALLVLAPAEMHDGPRCEFASEGGGAIKGYITFDVRYIADTGSYLTNDTVYISLVKTSTLIPDDTEVLVHYRHYSATNATDWVELLPRYTIADFPQSWHLQDATNHCVLVMANYVPQSPEETNSLLKVGMKIAMGLQPVDDLPLTIVSPRTKLETPNGENQ